MSNENPIYTFTNGTTADGSKVTANFEDIYDRMVTAAGDTLTGTLNVRHVIPTADNTYDLGSSGNKIRNLYIAGTISGAGAPGNNFGTVAVSGQSDLVADAAADTLTIAAGTNMTITTTAGTDTVTFTAAGPISGGTDNRVVRCDGTTALQSSAVGIDDSGNVTGVESINIGGYLTGGEASTITLSTGDNNNVSLSNDTVFPVDGSAGACVITGLTGGTAGRIITLVNIGSAAFTIDGEDAASTAANRIAATSGNIAAGTAIDLRYLSATSRWYYIA